MIFHYAGKYDGDESKLPSKEHHPNAVPFKEPEDMSKKRFILMSLCPNIVLGLIPYVIFLLFPNLVGVGFFGLMCIGMGFGDYINVYNALTQMPAGSKTYLCGLHSYWYVEDKEV